MHISTKKTLVIAILIVMYGCSLSLSAPSANTAKAESISWTSYYTEPEVRLPQAADDVFGTVIMANKLDDLLGNWVEPLGYGRRYNRKVCKLLS